MGALRYKVEKNDNVGRLNSEIDDRQDKVMKLYTAQKEKGICFSFLFCNLYFYHLLIKKKNVNFLVGKMEKFVPKKKNNKRFTNFMT